MEYTLLNKIQDPEILRTFNRQELSLLCKEIRHCLLETISHNGGHLASNLGVVELTVALHRVFSSPKDAIIFDVGHQCYTHKLLTGRFSSFATLRQLGGISGFMRPDESVHDPVITGHSSTSVSAAYGISVAKKLQNDNAYTVAVIGDGALTGGMVYEALNNAGNKNTHLIVILNDNEMSISKNVGALARQLNTIRTKPGYYKFKDRIENVVLHIPLVGQKLRRTLFRSKTALKNAIYNTNIFEGLGFNYMGPVDGHDIQKMEDLLKIAKRSSRPVLLHCITTKGRGYAYAEEDPSYFHGVSPFDIKAGNEQVKKDSFSSYFGKILCELAQADSKICAITAAMGDGTGLNEFAKRFKDRYFDVGIAEQHAVTFAAGLASAGLKPVFAVYSSFLQRGIDQILHDAAIGNLPITLCVDRAGFVGEDGETHQGLFDVSLLSTIPNVTIYSPANYAELQRILTAVLQRTQGVVVIRYPRGAQPATIKDDTFSHLEFDLFSNNGKIAILTYGTLFAQAKQATDELCKKGIAVDLIKINCLTSSFNSLIPTLLQYKNIYFFEEGMLNGSVAQNLAQKLLSAGYKGNYSVTAVESFIPHATVVQTKEKYGLDAKGIVHKISEDQL